MESALICRFKNCNKFFKDPILLPCYESICNNHLKDIKEDKFNCVFCKKDHQIPENGFLLQKSLIDILNLNFHLTDQGKEAKKVLKELEKCIEDIEMINNDPENYIFEYFLNIRNKIDLERERLKLSIDMISDQLMIKLNDYQKECKLNLDKIKQLNKQTQIDLNKLKQQTSDWQEMLRSPKLEDQNIKTIKNEIDQNLNKPLEVFEELKESLLIGKEVYFNPANTDFNLGLFADFNIRFTFSNFNNSKILTPNKAIDLFKLCEFNEKEKFNLIYRASEDGFKASDFHNKCDDKPNTLTIIKVKGNSNIFGGFTSCTWNHTVGFKSDPSAFIFSLINKYSNPIKINQKPNNYAICANLSYGPTFGRFDIYISDSSNLNNSSYSNLGRSYNFTQFQRDRTKAKNFLAGSYYFSTDEIEVYHKC